MSQVSVINVSSYDEGSIYNAICGHLEMAGKARLPHPGARVLLKPNLLSGRKPETAVTTHWSIISALIRRLQELGISDIVVADSPGGLYTPEHFRSVCSAAGLRRPGIEEYLNNDFTFGSKQTQKGFSVRSFNLITPVLQADYIINLPKLKTHAMTTVSAGVKNLFGAIPGLQKPGMHRRFPELAGFVRMLCELAATISPGLTILDAVDSMEGNGPGGGTVKHTGLTLASSDVFALDTAACRFMGLDPGAVPHLIAASGMGLLPDEVKYVGDPFAACPEPFTLPDATKSTSFIDSVPKPFRGAASRVMDWLLRSYPSIDASKCVGCGRCAESCPQHIIKLRGGKASMPRRDCISCFCCQEMCPVHAISAKRCLKNF